MKPRYARPSTEPSTQLHPVDSARAVGLRYVTDDQPGIGRARAGAGFRYVDAQGKAVRDEATLRRIRSLAIPPAWTDVWICPHENGHLQATGRDAKGRKQHRYHSLWREVRDATKYDRMIEFGKSLPRIRRRVTRDIARPGLSREKVLATIVRLMDLTFIRVGNEEYAKQNRSFGLTTLQDGHARVRGDRVQFSFRGKSGKNHTIEVEDARLAKIVKRCQDIPGQDLFQFLDEKGARHDVTSGDVNEYLREVSGSEFTAKDFRTWAGTVLAAQALQSETTLETQKQAKSNVRRAIEVVADRLGNTPAVCRKCYVHPHVIDGYMENRFPCHRRVLPANGERAIRASARPSASLGCDEQQVLEFLRCCRREERKDVRRLQNQWRKLPREWRPKIVNGARLRRNGSG
jgi:DNA topoisomerase I